MKNAYAVTVADRCREMGLKVGDTIEGRETHKNGYWHDARLTLLWLGESIAVWREIERSSHKPDWDEPEESAAWTLDYRDWRIVSRSEET